MALRKWLTKKATETAEVVVTKTKETLQKNVETKIEGSGNAWLTIGKMAVLGLIFVLTITGSDKAENPVSSHPTSIVINNYVERREDDD